MSGNEMIQAAVMLFGSPGHVTALAERLGVDRTQVWRWSKQKKIPGPAAAAIKCWLEQKKS
jgi:transposase-like protein